MRFSKLWLMLVLVCGSAVAESPEATLQAARAAHQARDEAALTAHLQQLQAQQYVLTPYADYWRMLLRLENAEAAEVRAFLARNAGLPFADTVRIAWLKRLAKRDQWTLFFEELPRLASEDTAVQCLALLGEARTEGSRALARGKALWLSAASQPEECSALFDRMAEAGVIGEAEFWERAHLALEEGRLTVAKAALKRLPDMPAASLALLDQAYENPQRVLEQKTFTPLTQLGRELNLLALDRVGRSRPELALSYWEPMRSAFSAREQQRLWAALATYAARQHLLVALAWFERAGDWPLSAEQAAWKARAALRARQWPTLLRTLEAMPPAQQEEPAWRYWRARALKQAANIGAANALLVTLARERNFYGLLAEEELGDFLRAPPATQVLGEADLRAVEALPAIRRAFELYRLDLRWEGRREWDAALRTFDDRQLLAAAELAFRRELYDIAIAAADRTAAMHDFSLRYPTPYRELLREYVRENALDEAWVYGLIRQESRFVGQARSRVGASGLMQVMPETGRWIARRLGLADYTPDMIYRTDINLRFGTHYLRYTMDRAEGQPVVATAAYNAGPGRALRWRPEEAMAGEIYAETIPFAETRDYVKKVMSNAYFYALRLGAEARTLKERLGLVQAAAGSADAPAAAD